MRLDIVGCGAALHSIHVPFLNRLSKATVLKVRGCFDVDLPRAQKAARLLRASRWGTPECISDFDSVDAALIATPPEYHADLASLYLSEGKHVLIEKPFTARYQQAVSLIDLSRRRGGRILVGHFRRFYPSLDAARRLLRTGALGQIERIEATEGIQWSWPARSNYFVESKTGGIIYDTGSHLIDMVLYLLALDAPGISPSFTVKSCAKTPSYEPSHECSATIELWTREGGCVEVMVHVSRTHTLAGAITVWAGGRILLVPTSFSLHADFIASGERVLLKSHHMDLSPVDSSGCVFMEHQALVGTVRDPCNESVLDGERFLLLAKVLETLVDA